MLRFALVRAVELIGEAAYEELEPGRCFRTLTDRVADVTPTLDGFDVAVHRSEVRAHRHDRYVASPGFAPRRNIAGPMVVPAAVLLDGFEAECIGIPSEVEQLGLVNQITDLNGSAMVNR
jgi:hypothetical protein